MRLRPDIESAEQLDEQLAHPDLRAALTPEMFNWSRAVREAMGVGAVDVAGRMRISQSAVTQLEQREARGTITMAKLEALAKALDCDLVYGFVPKTSFADAARRIQARQDKARRAKRKLPRALAPTDRPRH